MLEVTADDTSDGQDDTGACVLLARRHRYTGSVSYFRGWSPPQVPLAKLVWVVCWRWKIEEDFQTAKPLAWTRARSPPGPPGAAGAPAVLTAYAFLAALERDGPNDSPHDLIRLTCPELLRLLRLLILPTPRRDAAHVLPRSMWRRRHQHRARACHRWWHTYTDTPS